MDALTLLGLRGMTRERLNDRGITRPRWSDIAINRSLNEAEQQACLRARLLFDEASKYTQITIVPNQAAYLLHPSIFEVHDIRDTVTTERLELATEDQLYLESARWRTVIGTAARKYILQILPNERLQLLFTPVPSAATTLQLSVYRTPIMAMESNDDPPEIAPRHHDGLIAWACYRCLSIRDVETYDPVKAADHKADFEKEFGILEDANVRRKKREKRNHTMVARDF
jgi:hypothetical protein